MNNQRSGKASTDYFVWSHQDTKEQKTNLRVVEGGEHTRISDSADQLGDALALFNGEMRAIKRSTGGLTLAEPYQLLFYDELQTRYSGKLEVKIKVRFRDFRGRSDGSLTTGELVYQTKVVSASDLYAPIEFQTEGPEVQSYIIDFGQGIIPVHVVQFDTNDAGEQLAYFVEYHDLGQILRSRGNEKTLIPVYCVPREILRVASRVSKGGRGSELDFAKENYANNKSENTEVIPEALRAGSEIEVPACQTAKEIREEIRKQIRNRKTPKQTEKLKHQGSTETLIPFGDFEDR